MPAPEKSGSALPPAPEQSGSGVTHVPEKSRPGEQPVHGVLPKAAHCANEEKFRELSTPVLTFICGETAATHPELDAWMHFFFKQARSQVLTQRGEIFLGKPQFSPISCSEEENRRITHMHAEDWTERFMSHQFFFKLDADGMAVDHKSVLRQVGLDASAVPESELCFLYNAIADKVNWWQLGRLGRNAEYVPTPECARGTEALGQLKSIMGLPSAAERLHNYDRPENVLPPRSKGATIIMMGTPRFHASPIGQSGSGSSDHPQALTSRQTQCKGKGGPEKSGPPELSQVAEHAKRPAPIDQPLGAWVRRTPCPVIRPRVKVLLMENVTVLRGRLLHPRVEKTMC